MRVLMPDFPEFQALELAGLTKLLYNKGHLPEEDADGLVLWFLPKEKRLAALRKPSLKWVLTLTAGVDHVLPDLPPGVRLYNAHRLHDAAVAQHAAATILSAVRGLHRARDAQLGARWARVPTLGPLWTLQGREVVVWGYGHIGRIMERQLTPFGARVTGLRSSTPQPEIDAAVARADVLVLLLPATPQTKGIVNAEVLSRLKPGAWLANYGRGELVVTPDLIAALQSGHLGGSILDVTSPEPLPADSPLWTMPNVIITPHIGSTTDDQVARGAQLTQDFLATLARGEEPPGRVQKNKGY